MKKFCPKIYFTLVALLFLVGNVWAEKVGEIEFANKGKFGLGIQIGVPGIKSTYDDRANMPSVILDGAWGLAHGFINSKTFGKNGAVDLGFYYSFCHYRKWEDKHHGYLQNTILIRSAFHFEFVKNLDVYAGLTSGVNLYHPAGKYWSDHDKDVWDYAKYAGGIFTGAKWYFTEFFGAKFELQFDWGSPRHGNLPIVAGGVTFNFR